MHRLVARLQARAYMSGEVETEAEGGSADWSERGRGSRKRWRRRGKDERERCRERWGEEHQYSL